VERIVVNAISRVLVSEDDEAIRHLAQRVLVDAGFDVHEAADVRVS